MACFHPISMYMSGRLNAKTGNMRLTSYGNSYDSDTGKFGRRVNVPCNRCIGCRLEYSRQWAGRIMAELQTSDSGIFVTLTYRDEELIYGGQSHGILVPDHLQRFWKRLRKYFGGRSIRYFACGEYGDKSRRPHYHACIFDVDFPDKKYHSFKDGNYLYTSATLDRLWTHGMCTIGDVTFESAAYVARYCLKKRMGNTKVTYDEEGITPEFARMSRRPAIGAKWYERFHKDVFPGDNFVIRDFPSKPPRFFMKMLKENDPRLYAQVVAERAEAAEQNWQENEPVRLKVRERVKNSQRNLLPRNLE